MPAGLILPSHILVLQKFWISFMFLLIGSVLPLFKVNKSLMKEKRDLLSLITIFLLSNKAKIGNFFLNLHQCQISYKKHYQISKNALAWYILIVLMKLLKKLFKRQTTTVQNVCVLPKKKYIC